jgi:hypothetical protein
MIMLLTVGLLSPVVAGERLDMPNRDTEWDWDMLYDEYENEFWVCRGVQTECFTMNTRTSSGSAAEFRRNSLQMLISAHLTVEMTTDGLCKGYAGESREAPHNGRSASARPGSAPNFANPMTQLNFWFRVRKYRP